MRIYCKLFFQIGHAFSRLQRCLSFVLWIALLFVSSIQTLVADDKASEDFNRLIQMARGDDREAKEKAFSVLKEKANSNHAEAQYHLGRCYQKGWGMAKSPREAAAWFLKASRSGHQESVNRFAGCLLAGEGVEQDIERGLRLLIENGEQENANALYNVGWAWGHGLLGDVTEELRKKHELPDQTVLARWLAEIIKSERIIFDEYSWGMSGQIRPFPRECVDHYIRAARLSHPYASLILLIDYYLTSAQLKESADLEDAIMLAVNISQMDDPFTVSFMSEILEKSYLFKPAHFHSIKPACDSKARQLLRTSAAKGDVQSQWLLHLAYSEGQLGIQKNKQQGRYWRKQYMQTLTKLAKEGDASAQYELAGDLYREFGEKKQKDEKTRQVIAHWYEQAARQGHPNAQRQIGLCYRSGWGVPREPEKEKHWLKEAENQGITTSDNLFQGDGSWIIEATPE